jgi:hypothetical protein
VPKGLEDFHCNLRFTNEGNFIEIVNAQGSTMETLTFIYNELKVWVPIVGSLFGATLKGKAEGKPG